ncbi:MAG: LacI family DNA-binding transcriptional regulator [Kiritimatiellae bacterium]|nr:LacI family DNA-binding transcriptional regulator [Kiritimatiellia bacterium]
MASWKVSLAQVAKACDVSKSTVSRVLNNYEQGFSVRPEIRERILETAKKLNYRPNLTARSLGQRKTGMVAILGYPIAWDYGNGVYAPMRTAAGKVLQQAGFDMLLNIVHAEDALFTLPKWQIDGALVFHALKPEDLDELERTGTTYVSLNGCAGPSGSAVLANDKDGARQAVEYLAALGHKRIAYLDGGHEEGSHYSTIARYAGYMEKTAALGLEPIYHRMAHWHPAEEFSLAVGQDKATAILTSEHMTAIRLIHLAHERGIAVPEQLSVMGFNDELVCQTVYPTLTCMAVPSKAMGTGAAELLLKSLKGDRRFEPERIVLKEELVVRASTAAPRRSAE